MQLTPNTHLDCVVVLAAARPLFFNGPFCCRWFSGAQSSSGSAASMETVLPRLFVRTEVGADASVGDEAGEAISDDGRSGEDAIDEALL